MWQLIIAAILLVLSVFSGDYGPLAIAVPLALWGLFSISAKNSLKAYNEVTADANTVGYQYSFYSNGTGIAVATDKKSLKLQVKGKTKEYPFEMIRSWETNIQTGGNVVGTGFAVAANNMAAAKANIRNSGLFVYTKDIDNVEWRIEMLKKVDQAKWMEILRQNINES